MPFDFFRERSLQHIRAVMAFAFFFLTWGSCVSGQSDLPNAGSSPPATDASSPAEVPGKSPDEFRFTVAWVSTGGSYIYVPEKWGELRINLVNNRDEPRDLMCATYFQDQPNLQFGRRVWVPAKSTLRISHPIVIPARDPSQGRALNLQSLVVDATEGGDVLVKNNTGQMLHDGALLVTFSGRNTGLIGTTGTDRDVPSAEVTDLIMATRVSQQLSNRYSLLLDQFLPADESELSSLDHLVLLENRITQDLAAMAALRHWLHQGGRLWIMMDQVDPIVLESLFGDDFKGHVVDRVGLTTVRIDKGPTLSNPDGDVGESTDHEEPVEFVRMVTSNIDVTHEVNGWPAAMTKAYGDGRVLITTLGPRGWMTARPPNSRQSEDPAFTSQWIPLTSMNDIASDFFAMREPELIAHSAMEPQVREYVGYTIPSWGLIVGTLIGFSLVLVLIALALLRSGRLESLGWIGSLLAIAVSIGLLSIGRSYRHGIPATVASIQVAQAMTGTDDVRTQGIVAVYQPEGSASPIQVTGGGRMMPDMSGLENSNRRMVTTDLGAWHWENLPQPPGLRATPFTRSETVVDRLEARASFDAQGMVGTYSGRLSPGSDSLIATRDGRLGVQLNGDGSFTARADDVFSKDQFLGAGLLSDEQDRRRRTLEKILANPKRKDYPDRPQLMFWSDQWKHGFQFGDAMKPQGTTLVAIPLILERPEIGSEFVIPSPLLTYRNQRNPDGSPPSTMWNHARKEWQERSVPATSWLNIQIPRELLPIQGTRLRIEMNVSGPIGRVEVLGLRNREVVSLETQMDPVGALAIEINDASVLSVNSDGGLILGISAGDPKRPELTQTIDKPGNKEAEYPSIKQDQNAKINYWRIESLTVQLWAKTIEPRENN